MKQIRSKIVPVMLVLAMVAGGAMLWAQERGGAADEERGDRAQRQVDREQMRERMRERWAARSERMREQLGVDEQEWEVLGPMIDEVRSLQAQSGTRGGFAGRGRGRGPGGFGRSSRWGGDTERELSAVQQAHHDLSETLEDENASETDVQEKLEALRSAREQHEQELEEARQSLREVLTPRQEAQLVILGVLE